MKSSHKALCVALLLVAPPLSIASDGELGWTSVSFCNGADICVAISTDAGNGLKDLSITVKGQTIGNLPVLPNNVNCGLLQDTKLISAVRADGGYENRLEVPCLDSSERKFIYQVWFYQGRVYKSELVAAVPPQA